MKINYSISTMARKMLAALFWGAACAPALAQNGPWTLKACIDHALEHNITLRTSALNIDMKQEEQQEARAALLPSLSASTTQQGGYRPFVAEGSLQNHLSYSGDYGINAHWTVWDGQRRQNAIKQSDVETEISRLSLEQSTCSIQEQIVQLYVQLLYMNEAVKVNSDLLDISRQNAERGREMYAVGKISKADLSQLEAQLASDEYNLVNSKGQLAEYELQMKELLRLDYDAPFYVASPSASDQCALADVPAAADVVAAAATLRPEVRQALLQIESGELAVEMARAGKRPTVSMQGSVGTNTMSGAGSGWGTQLKDNASAQVGVTLSVPISDNRATKTAVNKAKLAVSQARLEEEDTRRALNLRIQGCWINATTNQQRFRSAQVSVESASDSYELLSEQFRLGLKNIVQLTNAKTTLLNAQQSRLESKYLTLLYLRLLEFYETGTMGNIG